jgi:excisionase family DNA binding protein
MELIPLTKPSPASTLARLRQIEVTLTTAANELAGVRAELEQAMALPAPSASLLTVDEVATELRVDRTAVFHMLQSGDLRGVRLGKKRCVTRASLDSFVARLNAA